MVVRINTGKSIRRALSYNERKMSAGMAELLLAGNYPIDDHLLGFSEKMKRFQILVDHNPGIGTNAVHISLNFPPEERLTKDKLTAIAMEYIDRIGFADQPFLVYQHHDAHHPHIHIVTTNLKRYGKPINLNNLARDVSEPVRKQLESQFALIPADSRRQSTWPVEGIAPWPANYGKEATKHAITNIVGSVLASYKFDDLDQLNAILSQFRITAFRGLPGSRMEKTGGLVYQLLNRDGMRTGIPIKASAIYKSPTLKNLEKKFIHGPVKRLPVKEATKKIISVAISKAKSLEELRSLLEQQQIGLVAKGENKEAEPNLFVVDHRRKAVFTGDELNIDVDRLTAKYQAPRLDPDRSASNANPPTNPSTIPMHQVALPAVTLSIIQTLLSQDDGDAQGPDDMTKKKKKRRRGPSI